MPKIFLMNELKFFYPIKSDRRLLRREICSRSSGTMMAMFNAEKN